MRADDSETNADITVNSRSDVADSTFGDRRTNSTLTVLLGVVMIVLGFVAIAGPFVVTVVSALLFGWIFIFAGIAQIVYAFHSKKAGQIIGKLILAVLYLAAGIFVLANPLEGVLAFTIVLGVTILVQGIMQVVISLQMRRISHRWGWMLSSGLIGIVFGIYICSISPSAASWLIGTLIGVNLLFDGSWMLTMPLENRSYVQHL